MITGYLIVVFGVSSRVDTLGTFLAPNPYINRGPNQPFVQRALWAVSSNGQYAALIDARANGSVQVRRFDLLRHSTSVLRHQLVPRRLTDRDVRATAAAIAKERSDETAMEITPRSVELQLRRPSTWPVVTAVVVANDGAIWLRVGGHMLWPHARRPEDATVPWHFFSGALNGCGRVVLPSTATIFADSGSDVASVLNDSGIDVGMQIAPRPASFAPCRN